jgi:hypothetical protein
MDSGTPPIQLRDGRGIHCWSPIQPKPWGLVHSGDVHEVSSLVLFWEMKAPRGLWNRKNDRAVSVVYRRWKGANAGLMDLRSGLYTASVMRAWCGKYRDGASKLAGFCRGLPQVPPPVFENWPLVARMRRVGGGRGQPAPAERLGRPAVESRPGFPVLPEARIRAGKTATDWGNSKGRPRAVGQNSAESGASRGYPRPPGRSGARVWPKGRGCSD